MVRTMTKYGLIAGSLMSLLACESNSPEEAKLSSVGSTQLSLTLPDGTETSSVSWVLTGGALASPRMGTIDVGDADDTISALIGGIPVASGYTIELTGLTSDGLTCFADANFDIQTAGATVMVSVTLNCGLRGTQNDGNLVVNGQVNTCPMVELVVSPIEVVVGNTMDLEAEAEDANGDDITFEWSASNGTIAESDESEATYTCTLAGPVTLELKVDDGFGCDVTREVDVTCRPDASGSDQDGDGVLDALDNCPLTDNADQSDLDGDGVGDVCDDDRDGDDVDNGADNCAEDANPDQEDLDADGLGDACDTDVDGDDVDNQADNCPFEPNPGQLDSDGDGVGDACTNDADSDGVDDDDDNCPDDPNPDQADFDGDGAGDACDPIFYTAGHGDLAFEFEFVDGEFEVLLEIEGGTVDGLDDVDGEFPTELLHIVTDATFMRPNSDGGAFAPLCVDSGDEVAWLPQGNADATANGVPFLGIANEAPSGVFVDDRLSLELVEVQSPAGTGEYALWKDGFPPAFSMSSCDGIDATDAALLEPGHDHFNMGFGSDGVGVWDITYRISGELLDGSTVEEEFTIHYDIR